MYPPKAVWNKDIVLFAHGYVDARQPIGIPWGQLISDEANLPAMVLSLGYAFGTTSYSANGLAVKQGVTDIVKLAQYVRAGRDKARKVYLTGASEGGLITALAMEKYPQLFASGLSTCGPVGSFLDQVQYWGDFRVAFDYVFPNVLLAPPPVIDPTTGMLMPVGSSTPVAIDPLVVQYWEYFVGAVVIPELMANPDGAAALLAAAQVPFDPYQPQTVGESILGLLYYNVQATNNGRMVLNPAVAANPSLLFPPSLAGNPYENLAYVTPFYPAGLTRDPAALSEILANYETSAKLARPLVLMHTTGDPIIPYSQALTYLQKAYMADKLDKIKFIPVDRYGHCAFTAPELIFAFNMMISRDTMIPFSEAQVQAALPSGAEQAKYNQLVIQYSE
jgi:hypothetical protein